MTNICFVHHPQCIEQLDVFISRHGDGRISTQEAMRHIEKLLTIHFTKMIQLCFLCLDSHLNDYKDAKLRKLAEIRLAEMLEVLRTHVCCDEQI